MDDNIWQNCRDFLCEFDQKKDSNIIDLIPVKDADSEPTAYGYQNHEANRESRYLP